MVLFAVAGCSISIHALRVEGDRLDVALRETQLLFLSTPSGWRATGIYDKYLNKYRISIHALRVEGDNKTVKQLFIHSVISIHALRVEGDRFSRCFVVALFQFLSTPSGWRATLWYNKV